MTNEAPIRVEEIPEDLKEWIDQQGYETLLRWWRFAPPGDPAFAGETGRYYAKVMRERRQEEDDAGEASKRIGWDPPGAGQMPPQPPRG